MYRTHSSAHRSQGLKFPNQREAECRKNQFIVSECIELISFLRVVVTVLLLGFTVGLRILPEQPVDKQEEHNQYIPSYCKFHHFSRGARGCACG